LWAGVDSWLRLAACVIKAAVNLSIDAIRRSIFDCAASLLSSPPQTQLAQLQAPFPPDRHGALGSTQLQARLYDR
jgi:hypothetical protein